MKSGLPHRLLLFCLAFFRMGDVEASPWVGGVGTAIPVPGGELNMSGASWNPESGTLWLVRQNRVVWEVGFVAGPDTFRVLRTLTLPNPTGGDLESCTQVDYSADELYTFSETQGRLARIEQLSDSAIVTHVWNFEQPNNGYALPRETPAGDGAEGVTFVPDAWLYSSGFRYPDGSTFLGSTRGMHGLIFVGHQVAGRVHVFDVNPDVSEDFINHGSFLTSASETCGLAFDRSVGLLYIWHNPSDSKNSLEVSRLTSNATIGVLDRYEVQDTGTPIGNFEDIAIVPWDACGTLGSDPHCRTLFLVQDGGTPNLVAFSAFICSGTTLGVGDPPRSGSGAAEPVVYPNPSFGRSAVSVEMPDAGWLRVGLYDLSGRWVRDVADEHGAAAGPHRYELGGEGARKLAAGLYFVRVESPWGRTNARLIVLE